MDASAMALAALTEQLARRVQQLHFTKDLAPVQWSALRFFAKAGPSARTVGGLAAYSGVNQSSASRTIHLLAAKGLVTIEAVPGDGRVRQVTLKAAGWGMLERDPLAKLSEAIGRLAADDQAHLRDLLAKLLFEMTPGPFDGRKL